MSKPVDHLGDRLSAFVDGELDHAGRERVLSHLAQCPGCRDQVEAERAAKRRVRDAAVPQPPEDLTRRLAALIENTVPREVRVPLPAAAFGGAPPTRGDARRPARSGARRRVGRVRVAALGGSALAAVALGAAFAVGGGQTGGRPVRPPVGQFTLDHAAVTGEVPLTGPAGRAVTVSVADTSLP